MLFWIKLQGKSQERLILTRIDLCLDRVTLDCEHSGLYYKQPATCCHFLPFLVEEMDYAVGVLKLNSNFHYLIILEENLTKTVFDDSDDKYNKYGNIGL